MYSRPPTQPDYVWDHLKSKLILMGGGGVKLELETGV
jgi:hypothetical protein